jgi:hypothetical protein
VPRPLAERFRKCSVMARGCRERVELLHAARRLPSLNGYVRSVLRAPLWAVSMKRPDQKAKRARLRFLRSRSQPFVSAPVHSARLVGERIEEAWPPAQLHPNLPRRTDKAVASA